MYGDKKKKKKRLSDVLKLDANEAKRARLLRNIQYRSKKIYA